TSGLLVKDFANTSSTKAGFRTDHVLLLTVEPSLVGYDEARGRAFFRQAQERISGLPGVKTVALGEHVPLGVTSSFKNVVVEGYEMARGQQSLVTLVNTVDHHYFNVMQIPVINGRGFQSSDTASSPPVVVVNQTMAEMYWPKR